MRIGIDARTGGGRSGGVEMVVIGLAQGFAALGDGDEEYVFLVDPRNTDWLEPFLGPNCRMIPARPVKLHVRAFSPTTWIAGLRYLSEKLGDAVGKWRNARALAVPASIPASNGRIEAAEIDVMHFTIQGAFATKIPSIYHPHDLQHRHFPEFFTTEEVTRRDALYRYFCDRAEMVAAASSWVKSDLVSAYGLPRDKVEVIAFAPPNLGYRDVEAEEIERAAQELNLPRDFAFYPAQTWPHKNHIRLIRAAARLRDTTGLAVNLVFSGHRNKHFAEIEREVTALKMQDAVTFLGFVSATELQCLYKLARCVVVPSFHEAGSFPIWEAFLAGTPVASSNVTSLPLQVGEAGLLFDPESEDEIAKTLETLWCDAALRDDLAQKGRERVARFTWKRTAQHFRAHYRRIGGRDLTEEDRALLESPPML